MTAAAASAAATPTTPTTPTTDTAPVTQPSGATAVHPSTDGYRFLSVEGGSEPPATPAAPQPDPVVNAVVGGDTGTVSGSDAPATVVSTTVGGATGTVGNVTVNNQSNPTPTPVAGSQGTDRQRFVGDAE